MIGRGLNGFWKKLCLSGKRGDAVAKDYAPRSDSLAESFYGLPEAAPGTDWRWRPAALTEAIQPASHDKPEPGLEIGPGLTLWHDCSRSAVVLSQLKVADRPEYELQLATDHFGGEYLSLSMDLPDDVLADLGSNHLLRLDGVLSAKDPILIYARLNLVQGPNTAEILRQMGDPIAGTDGLRLAEFDLAYTEMDRLPVSRGWLDLILQAPGTNVITVHDLILSRRPRAQV